ncbi:uncharacterized protein [Blastocystis hominis]|uniref:Uncharacterized protein n=1 Tax=Blastocystis hominis TaxID=12968 RepID=D8M5X6_BLAHO|nr:uncharacterized protein [Blastocystis hominis]CBK23575.2 unnamed protein product [Blastocystis hominis]|eukprot:XP_012897623.1 uncharacterized protein [Blastocystis hominis]
MYAKFVKPRFNVTVEEIQRLAQQFIANGKSTDKAIVSIPREKRTFQNVIKPLLVYDHGSQGANGTIGTLINVSPVKEVRDAANEASVAMSQYSMSRLVQNDLYTALNEFNEDRKKRNEKYDPDIEKYIQDNLTSMK